MIRTITRLLVLGILLVSTGLAWWYFVELLGRTDFASHRTSVSYDTIWIMYATCIVAALLGGYVLTKRTVSRIPASVMLMAALIPTIGFAYLNISGTVCWITKYCDCVPLFYTYCPQDGVPR